MIARQQGPAAVRNLNPVYVRFGSKADITRRSGHVRFTPESGHSICAAGGRLVATSCPGSIVGSYFPLSACSPIWGIRRIISKGTFVPLCLGRLCLSLHLRRRDPLQQEFDKLQLRLEALVKDLS